MEIAIRNMVCNRCIKSVTGIFTANGAKVNEVRLGKVILEEIPDAKQTDEIRRQLAAEGFEWMDDQKAKTVQAIKQEIIQLIQSGELDERRENLSDYLAKRLHKDYHSLSQLFSSMENTTIEQFFILQKIERVKEWLVYNEYSLSEMAFKLGYSSVAHLSGQFKKMTGFTPSQFRQLKDHHRKPLDQV